MALLRGINVGGNSLIKMDDLKKEFENAGFQNVKTYIQSGNVIFESGIADAGKIARKIEDFLAKNYHIETRSLVLTSGELRTIVDEAPAAWKNRDGLRCYVSFLLDGVKPPDVIKEIKLKEGVDSVTGGKGVVYMTTLLSGITKSGFTKLIAKPVYKKITMRNFKTVQKMLELVT